MQSFVLFCYYLLQYSHWCVSIIVLSLSQPCGQSVCFKELKEWDTHIPCWARWNNSNNSKTVASISYQYMVQPVPKYVCMYLCMSKVEVASQFMSRSRLFSGFFLHFCLVWFWFVYIIITIIKWYILVIYKYKGCIKVVSLITY